MEELQMVNWNVTSEMGIRNNYAAYTFAVDDHDSDAFVDCFTEDAEIEATSFSFIRDMMKGGKAPFVGHDGRIVGSKNIRHFHDLIPTRIKTLHLTTNLWITTINTEYAEARAAFAVLADDGIVEHYGRYFDKLRKCSDGRWRFSERVDACQFERRPDAFGL
jgi:SnoaL-like domain